MRRNTCCQQCLINNDRNRVITYTKIVFAACGLDYEVVHQLLCELCTDSLLAQLQPGCASKSLTTKKWVRTSSAAKASAFHAAFMHARPFDDILHILVSDTLFHAWLLYDTLIESDACWLLHDIIIVIIVIGIIRRCISLKIFMFSFQSCSLASLFAILHSLYSCKCMIIKLGSRWRLWRLDRLGKCCMEWSMQGLTIDAQLFSDLIKLVRLLLFDGSCMAATTV